MMKRLGLLAVCLLLASVTLGATWWPYPLKPPATIWYTYQDANLMAIDIPQPGSWGTSDGYFAGWAFNCDGEKPEILVWRFSLTGGILQGLPSYGRVMDVTIARDLYRPDVAAAFAGLPCSVTPYSGFHVYFQSGHPLGTQAYLVQAYSPGGTWNPQTGEWVDASAWVQFFVVIVQ